MKGRLNELRLRTPEGAEFSFLIASPVLRLCAVFLDWATIAVVWSVVGIALKLLNIFSTDFARWATIVCYFVLSLGYDMAFEWMWQGRTLGKKLLSLRVVDAAGLRLTLPQIVLRNLMRYVDLLPVGYAVGGAVALLNRRGQRLGDLAAGTLVIWEPAIPQPDPGMLSSSKYNSLLGQTPVVARLRQAVPPAMAQAAWMALRRRDQLDASARIRLFADMASHFRRIARVPEELTLGISDEQFVRNVVEVVFG